MNHFAQVLLPIRIESSFTYRIPGALLNKAQYGVRVEVQFGKKKRYAGLIVGLSTLEPGYPTKEILDVIDEFPIVFPYQYEIWQWMAKYYCCTEGEILNAALPTALKLTSETVFVLQEHDERDIENLNDQEYMIYKSLQHRSELTVEDVQGILDRKSIYPIINEMFRKGVVMVKEELKDRYVPKKKTYVQLTETYSKEKDRLSEAFDKTGKSEKQTQALLAFLTLSKDSGEVERTKLMQTAHVDYGVVKALEKKGVFEIFERIINRMDPQELIEKLDIDEPLSPNQESALQEIRKFWEIKNQVLLHGVTGSGKTHIYIQLIKEAIEKGEQVLFLLPEIALSIQIIARLKKTFSDQIIVSHSRLSANERVDLWKRAQEGIPVILGVRSSIFLPFQNLGLIIVDEEHDASFKQVDPSPRYQARDVAILMAEKLGAKVLLGTATPSLESYANARASKYGYVQLFERYQSIEMPAIEILDLRKSQLSGSQQIAKRLHDEMEHTLEKGEQSIIFKNRRGYAPILRCDTCGWKADCKNCDITLTYHKYRNNLHCHLCGYQTYVPHVCPACKSEELVLEGYGTQKIEDELQVLFPKARIGRMDFDTTRRKKGHERIIEEFENAEIDILVGTQMVTKGLDFDHVGLVGVIHGDQQLFFPDFRAAERTFQLLVQVSGRAGRKFKQGKVIIQTYSPDHPVFADVAHSDFDSFYTREGKERRLFKFPPFYRLIKINVKHGKRDISKLATHELSKILRAKLGDRILGPAVPHVAKARGKYIHDLGIKLEKDPHLIADAKAFLKASISYVNKMKGLSTVQFRIDVDP